MDALLMEFIKADRWQREIDIGYYKGINKSLLRQLVKPEVRSELVLRIMRGEYVILPPRMQLIPKDDGKWRTVYINENVDRIILSLINNILFDLCGDWVSKHCTSYQKGIGCGKVVRAVSQWMVDGKGNEIGCKTDLSKYFDTVPIEQIDRVFDMLKGRFGESPIIDVLQAYYHQDLCFDLDGNLVMHYQSLKQGCATASFFADVLLYDLDEEMATIGNYVRYSDDMLFIHKDWKKAKTHLEERLKDYGLSLNPKKVEYVTKDRWVKFLGFSVKGEKISLSNSRLKTFRKEIEKRTVGNRKATLNSALNAVNQYMYKGYGEYSWATSVLPIINCEEDINEMNKYTIDALKAVETGRTDIGGLGYEHKSNGVISRGKGKNVKANRQKVGRIDGYKSMQCMWKAINTNKAAYQTLVRGL